MLHSELSLIRFLNAEIHQSHAPSHLGQQCLDVVKPEHPKEGCLAILNAHRRCKQSNYLEQLKDRNILPVAQTLLAVLRHPQVRRKNTPRRKTVLATHNYRPSVLDLSLIHI